MKKLSFAFTIVIIVIILQLVKRSRSNVYWPQKDCLVIKRKKDLYTNHTHQPHKMPCLLLDIHFSWVLKYLSRHSYQNLLSSAYTNRYCQIFLNFETSRIRQLYIKMKNADKYGQKSKSIVSANTVPSNTTHPVEVCKQIQDIHEGSYRVFLLHMVTALTEIWCLIQ